MIRISVSELETYRYWLDDEESTLSDLVADLKHVAPPTPQMEAGRAFAKMFDHGATTEVVWDMYTVDGWTFDFTGNAFAMDQSPSRELKAEMVIETPSGPVTLVGMCDGIDGLVVHDQKLTERWDAEKYIDSLQWRAYLLMFGADSFVYDVFVGSYKAKTVTIREYHPLRFERYPDVERDVRRAVNALAAVIAKHLPERVTP